jgi:hypothetical protein
MDGAIGQSISTVKGAMKGDSWSHGSFQLNFGPLFVDVTCET